LRVLSFIVKSTKHIKYYLAASAALITFIVYLPALWNEFVNWDDPSYILENIHIRSFDTGLFKWAFFDFYAANWHPLTWISHALDYALWGLDPMGHHLTSIVLHAANSYLVVLLALKLLENAREKSTPNASTSFLNDRVVLIAAGVTGLLFGLHPVHVESVAWVAERKDLLCALFFLLSIIRYTKYAGSQKSEVRRRRAEDKTNDEAGQNNIFTNKHYLLALFFFVLALLSKPMAVTLPVVLLILDWYPLGRIRSFKTLWTAGVEKLPFITLSLISAIMTIVAQRAGGALTSTEAAPLAVRMLVAVKSLVGYLWNMLLPVNLIPLHPYPKTLFLLSAEYALPIIFAVVITIFCIIGAKQQKGWLAVWGYYLVTLLPVLGIVQIGSQTMADRYTYLPSIGPFLAVGMCAAWIATRMRKTRGLSGKLFSATVVILVFVPLSYLTVQQIRIWKDSITLWSHELEREPDVRHAYVNRGIAFMDAGQLEKAIADYDRAISMSSSDHIALYNRGIVFAKLNLVDQAIADYSAAIASNPSYYDAYNNRGILYERLGRYDKAFADYNAAISLNPSYFKAYVNRALIFDRAGQVDEALADFARAISLKPDDPDAYYNRGIVLSNMGQFNRALADFDKTIALNPSDYQAYYNRGIAFQKTGMVDKANRDFMIWKEYSSKP
jgi:tetratricopeptide (TPR) repeat protein